MNITHHKSPFIKVRSGDVGFYMSDGIVLVPRAGISFDYKCSSRLMFDVEGALRQGLIIPYAYVHENDHLANLIKNK